MKPIAVIGAGGYVGSRLIEQAELLHELPLVPVVRSWRSQGRLARFGVRTVRGDASDTASLVPLLQGCGMALNLTMGSNEHMVTDVQSIYRACVAAKVPLLVHTSSAEVFGRAESPAITEDSAPSGRHWMEYGRTKLAAEDWLRTRSGGPTETVILRPGLIWGPGSGWLIGPAKAMVDGSAYLINDGRGVCNLIHVDNLIRHIVELASNGPVESGVFNVSDLETLTWADYYEAIAHEVNVDVYTIHRLPESVSHENLMQKAMRLGNLPPAKAVKRRLTNSTKVRMKQQLQDWTRPPVNKVTPIEVAPSVTTDLWWVQGTKHKLPAHAFRERFPNMRLQSFSELMAAAGRWLRYAGFEQSDGIDQFGG